MRSRLEFWAARLGLRARPAKTEIPSLRLKNGFVQDDNRDRKITIEDRFQLALSRIAGKWLTFAEVTSKWMKMRPSNPFCQSAGKRKTSQVFASRLVFISECGTESTFFSALSKFAYSALIERFGFFMLPVARAQKDR
jgi:hypothetical protein